MQIDSKVSDRGYQTTPGTTQKADGAANAPADQKATAASSAALAAGVNGVVDAAGVEEEDESSSEKLKWTHQLRTQNQTILAKAKMANEFETYVLEKAQELTLGTDTFAGDSEIYNRYDKFI